MFKITSQLSCDRCGVEFRKEITHLERFHRKDLDLARARAYKSGWRRFRPKSNLSIGDFCSLCVEKMTRVNPNIAKVKP